MWLESALLLCIVTVPIIFAAQGSKSNSYGGNQNYGFGGYEAISTPEECQRTCKAGEPPKICYFHFTMENYNVNGTACRYCKPSEGSGRASSDCQCVMADGVRRGILTVNRMIPGPSIQVCEGDKVVIDVENHMAGMETSIHWHGVFQKGSQYYDGVPRLTQCSIQEASTFRYQWIAGNAGTHFWHSHDGLQELEGLYGSLVVRKPQSNDPSGTNYDDDLPDHVILISDWMHDEGTQRFPGYVESKVGQTPVTLLINGKGRFKDSETGSETKIPRAVFKIKSGRRYRFRFINAFATVCPAQLSFESHQLTVIASDGEPVSPVAVNTVISFSGERYDFVINADQPVDAYWIQLRGLGECGDERLQTLGVLSYDDGPDEPTSSEPTYDNGLTLGIVLNPLDAICNVSRGDAVCVNQLKNARKINKRILRERPDVKIFLPYRFYVYEPEKIFETVPYKSYLVNSFHLISLIDGISFQFPSAPPLSQVWDIDPQQFCNGDDKPANCGEDCKCTHTIQVPLNAVVEVIIVDEIQQPNLSHPFHLHGHAFNVIGIGRSPDKNIRKINLKHVIDLDRRGLLERKFDIPPGKDTIAVPHNGYVVLRFLADNPGWWLFHCHFVYHMEIGMQLVFQVGTQADLPPIPPYFPTCGNYLPPIFPP